MIKDTIELIQLICKGYTFIHQKFDYKRIKNRCVAKIEGVLNFDPKKSKNLLATFIYKNEELAFLELLDKTFKDGNNHLFVSADGGFGKTTNMIHAVNEIMEDKKNSKIAIYIPCNRIDRIMDENERNSFIIDSIGEIFDGYNKKDRFGSLKSLLKNKRIIVFFDAINESINKTSLFNQIQRFKDISVEIPNCQLQTVVSSRTVTDSYINHGYQKISMKHLDPEKILEKRNDKNRINAFQNLPQKTKAILGIPMFLKMFIASEEFNNVTAAGLLLENHHRTIKKAIKDDDTTVNNVLDTVFPAFTSTNNKDKMVFTNNDINNYLNANPNITCTIEDVKKTLKISGDVITNDDEAYAYKHEHIRDFYVAYNMYKKLINNPTLQDIYDLFPKKNIYGIFVQRFLGELLGKKRIEELLNLLKRIRINDEEKWSSEHTSIATSEIIELLKIYTEDDLNDYDIGFKNLNLSETKLNNVYINGANFEGSIIKDETFAPSSIDSAIFSMIKKEDILYAICKNKIIMFSKDLEDLGNFEFENGSHIISAQFSYNKLIVLNNKGNLILFESDATIENWKEIERIDGVKSFICDDSNNLYISFTNGKILDNITKKEYKLNSPVYLINATETRLLCADNDGLRSIALNKATTSNPTPELCKFDDMGEIQFIKYYNKLDIVIIAFNKSFGKTELYSYNFNNNNPKMQPLEIIEKSEEEIGKLRSRNIDPSMCNDIDFIENNNKHFMIISINDGRILTYTHNNNDWLRLGENQIVPNNKNGFAVESVKFFNNSIICGTTDRELLCLTWDQNNFEDIGFIKRKIHGANHGLRNLIKVADNIFATMYDQGFVILSKEANSYRFKDKVKLHTGWSWAICKINDKKIAVSLEEKIYIYENNIKSLFKTLDSKIGYLAFIDGYILATTEKRVYKIPLDEPEKIVELTTNNDCRKPLCIAKSPDNNIYFGYSSSENEGAIIKQYDFTSNTINSINASKWKYTDGWYRHIEFSSDGEYILCAGLKSTDDSHKDISVILDRNFKTIAILDGHEDYVLCAKWIEYTNEDNVMTSKVVSCSYDGSVKTYDINIRKETNKVLTITPYKESEVKTKPKLFDILISDGNLLVTSLDGHLYQWKDFCSNSQTKLEPIYRNICGLWTMNSDFTKIDKYSENYEYLSTLNNIIEVEATI